MSKKLLLFFSFLFVVFTTPNDFLALPTSNSRYHTELETYFFEELDHPLGLNGTNILAGFDIATKGVKAVTEGFKGIVDAFKTTKTSEVKSILEGKGFKEFSASAQMNKVIGLQESYFPTFKQHLYERIQVPEDRKKDLDFVLQDFEYMDEQTWTAYKMAFTEKTGGDCKFVALLANRNSTSGKINMLIADIKAGA